MSEAEPLLSVRGLIKYFPVDTRERQNGWYVLAFSLDIENMTCDIKQFVNAVAAEGAPVCAHAPDSCRTVRAAGRVMGARSARAATPQAPLTRAAGSR